MSRHLLRVASLRSRSVPRITAEPRDLSEVIASPDHRVLSRRNALGIAGLASIAAAPMARAVGSMFNETFVVRRRGQRVAFLVAGIERWVLDPKSFDGSPVVTFTETDDHIDIQLLGARYPGTDLSADLACRITKGSRATARFTFPAFGAAADVQFVPWLLDKVVARTAVSAHIQASCTDARFEVAAAEIRYRASWVMRIVGTTTMRTGALTLHADAIDACLLTSDRSTLLAAAAQRRSLLRIDRNEHAWIVPLSLQGLADWRIGMRDDAFDTLTIECASDGRTACLLEGATDGAVSLLPTNLSAALPLRDVRYAWVRTDEGLHEALVARYGRQPVWLQLGGMSAEVGERDEVPPLEITSVNGRVTKLNVAPGFLRYAIPVDGAVVEPTAMQHGSQLALITTAVAAYALPKAHFHMAALQIDAKVNVLQQLESTQRIPKDASKKVKASKSLGVLKPGNIKLPGNPRITVIRPDDLLVLTFEFAGISLNKGAGTFTASGSNARLIVHFQPQHIAERAFFYTQEKPNSDELTSPPNPLDAKKNLPSAASDEPLLDPPIDAVLSHGSRLVLNVPAGYAGLLSVTPPENYDPTKPTKMLLDWSAFTLNVSPSAKPPSSNMAFAMLAPAFANKFSGVLANKGVNTSPTKVKQAAKGSAKTRSYTMHASASKLKETMPAAAAQFESNPDFATAIPSKWIDELAQQMTTKPPIREPNADETAIEYPYRLIMSPNKYAGWAHTQRPAWGKDLAKNPTRRVELWHTRLGVKHSDGSVNEDAAYFRTMRAIWSPDVDTHREMSAVFKERPFRTSINRRDRFELVRLTSDYSMATEEAPVEVRRFMMTSLGAWADMVGGWDPLGQDGLDVEQWIQRGTHGRDHFVRICYKGFLFPFGHRATLVKETERKFRRTPRGDMAAYLMQRLYIILRQPVREYPADGLKGQRYQGRDIPFRTVQITTKTTPNLNLPVKLNVGLSENSFWPQFNAAEGTQDVMWSCIGKDWDGKEAHFSAPLAFIANTDATFDADLKTWIDGDYQNKAENKKRRAINMGGQGIAFAPSTKVGDTSLPVETFTINGYYSDTVVANTVRFFPWMEKAKARIEKVDELLGTQTGRDVSFAKQFLDFAFEAGTEIKKEGQAADASKVKNPGQIFLKLLQTAGMNFGAQSDKSGGLAAPSIDIAGLSRLTGPVAGKIEAGLNSLEDLANSAAAAGSFDPMEYFGDLLDSKILGDITLKDVLGFVGDLLNNIDKVPGLDKKDEFGIKESANEIKTFADSVKTGAQGIANDVSQEVKDARDALISEVDKVKSEIQTYINEGKQVVEDRIKEWKKKLEDRLNELKSEVDKAIKPLKDAGNEAYKKYEQAQGFLNTLKQGLQLVYEWQTEIKSSPGNILVPLYPGTMDKDKKAILYLKAEFIKKLDLQPPIVTIYGSLSNFVINLIGDGAAQFLIIKFNYLKVSAIVGQKPKIDPSIEDVEFAGPLTFVNKLRDLIPKGGGGGGGGVSFSFEFDVKPSGITASLTIGLPNVTVGVFSLQNMSFLMRLTVPFDGRSFAAYFAFCTKENPFRLTVMMFAGGGFFGIEITPKGVRMLEAAFEFGGNFGFDCGVASGGASVMAGIYYKLETKEIDGKQVEQSELTGYFRLQGNLSILGIIRINLLFELKLTWLSTGKVFGVATIEVEIEILFLSFSVGVTVERQLKGSDGDPTFKDMLPQASLWQEYCDCFA